MAQNTSPKVTPPPTRYCVLVMVTPFERTTVGATVVNSRSEVPLMLTRLPFTQKLNVTGGLNRR